MCCWQAIEWRQSSPWRYGTTLTNNKEEKRETKRKIKHNTRSPQSFVVVSAHSYAHAKWTFQTHHCFSVDVFLLILIFLLCVVRFWLRLFRCSSCRHRRRIAANQQKKTTRSLFRSAFQHSPLELCVSTMPSMSLSTLILLRSSVCYRCLLLRRYVAAIVVTNRLSPLLSMIFLRLFSLFFSCSWCLCHLFSWFCCCTEVYSITRTHHTELSCDWPQLFSTIFIASNSISLTIEIQLIFFSIQFSLFVVVLSILFNGKLSKQIKLQPKRKWISAN